jgi:hypothetical protein
MSSSPATAKSPDEVAGTEAAASVGVGGGGGVNWYVNVTDPLQLGLQSAPAGTF